MFTFLFCLSGYDRRWARQNASRIADGVWLLRNRWFSPYRLDEHNETCLPVDHNPSWKSIQFALAWKMPCLRRNSLLLLPAVRCRTTYRQEWAGCRSCWLRFESIDQSALHSDRNLTDLGWLPRWISFRMVDLFVMLLYTERYKIKEYKFQGLYDTRRGVQKCWIDVWNAELSVLESNKIELYLQLIFSCQELKNTNSKNC